MSGWAGTSSSCTACVSRPAACAAPSPFSNPVSRPAGLHGFQKPIRRVTKELGAARDIDVQLEALDDFMNSDPDKSHRPGIERLMLRLSQQRNKLQLRVVAEIDRLLASDVWDGLQRPLRELTVRANLRGTLRESKRCAAAQRSR